MLNGYVCKCDKGFYGVNCENQTEVCPEVTTLAPETTTSCPTLEPEPDYCATSPCQNGGTCFNTTGDYVCVCQDGYSGKNCSSGKILHLFQIFISIHSSTLQILSKSAMFVCPSFQNQNQMWISV